MTRTLFGTDGMRGVANLEPMTGSTVQRLGMAIAKGVAAVEQRGILTIVLDHVAEFAEVMDQQPQTAFVLVRRLHRLQQIGDQIFELGFFDFERHLKGALNAQSRLGLAVESSQQIAEL